MLINENFDIVLSEAIDQFLEDILFQEANKLNLPCYGLIQCFINGYFRVTSYGEANYLREPDIEEVNELISKVTKSNYIPTFIKKEKSNLIRSYFKKYFMNYLRFVFYFFYRYLPGKRFVYHYWASDIISRKFLHIIPPINLGDKNWERNLIKNKNTLFIPMQFFPESTIDYWANDIEMIEYEKMLPLFIKKFFPHFKVIIKEHPELLVIETHLFIERLRKFLVI